MNIIDELYCENLSTSLTFRWTREHKHDSAEYAKAADRFRKTLDRRRLKTFNALEEQMLTLTCHADRKRSGKCRFFFNSY